jgi:hypothetical protein
VSLTKYLFLLLSHPILVFAVVIEVLFLFRLLFFLSAPTPNYVFFFLVLVGAG